MKHIGSDQQGFIPMMLMILTVVIGLIIFVFLRVQNAQ